MPNCDARPKPAELGMAPNVLERGLSEVARPNEEKGVAEKVDVLEYGYASFNFFADWASACTALSTVGRGIKLRTVGLREGWESINAVRIGSNDCGGRVATHITQSEMGAKTNWG